MYSVTFLNHKGGVGKTSLGCNTAGELARRGYRVLVIDYDPQAHATLLCGSNPTPGVYDLMVRKAPWARVMETVSAAHYGGNGTGALYLLPGNFETEFIPMRMANPSCLRERLGELAGYIQAGRPLIDVVIIDTNPSPSMLHTFVYRGTDAIILVTKLEWLSLIGVSDSIEAVKMTEGCTAHILGIQPNFARKRVVLSGYNIDRLQKSYPYPVWDAIFERVAWGEASDNAELLCAWSYTRETKLALNELRGMVNRVEEGVREWQAASG